MYFQVIAFLLTVAGVAVIFANGPSFGALRGASATHGAFGVAVVAMATVQVALGYNRNKISKKSPQPSVDEPSAVGVYFCHFVFALLGAETAFDQNLSLRGQGGGCSTYYIRASDG